jgi:CheY-like chemotaxis protein
MMTPRARRRIMVIGFDANFCYLMQRYGRISAHKLVFANHSEDILAQARKNKPGVIFLEVAHPATFAWNLLKDLKTDQDTCHIPIVICSWQGDEFSSKQESADFHLRLPILYENFKVALEHVGAGFEEKSL